MRIAALRWEAGSVSLDLGGERIALPLTISREQRYWLGLHCPPGGSLFLRQLQAPPLRWSASDASFRPLPSPPADPVQGWRIHADDRVSVRGKGVLYVLEANEIWSERPLPDDIHVVDVDLDAQGGLWCVGAVPGRRLPGCDTEAAVRVQAVPKAPFTSRPLSLGLLGSMRAVRQGAIGELARVDAMGEPVLLGSLCAWYIEDESAFLFALGARRDTMLRLRQQTVIAIDRSTVGVGRVFTSAAERIDMTAKKTTRVNLRPALEEAIGVPNRYLSLRAVWSQGDDLLVVIEVSQAERTSAADDGEWSAVCRSQDSGQHFSLLWKDPIEDGAEWVGVAALQR